MKNKISMTFATLTLAAGLLLSVAAQNSSGNGNKREQQAQPKNPPVTVQKYEKVEPKPGIKFGTPVFCKQGGSGDAKAKIIAFNNTGQTIKQGTVINFSTNGGVAGSLTLNADLAAGTEKYLGKEDVTPYTCKAWFFKP